MVYVGLPFANYSGFWNRSEWESPALWKIRGCFLRKDSIYHTSLNESPTLWSTFGVVLETIQVNGIGLNESPTLWSTCRVFVGNYSGYWNRSE